MDLGGFDFTAEEAFALVMTVARSGAAESVELIPRNHDDADLTFRVSCVVRGGGRTFTQIAAIQNEAAVDAVLDRDRSVRFRRTVPGAMSD